MQNLKFKEKASGHVNNEAYMALPTSERQHLEKNREIRFKSLKKRRLTSS